MSACGGCGSAIEPAAPFCPHCGAAAAIAPVKKDRTAAVILGAIIGLPAGFVVGCILAILEYSIVMNVGGRTFEGTPVGGIASPHSAGLAVAAVTVFNLLLAGIAGSTGLFLARRNNVGFASFIITTAIAMLFPATACTIGLR